MISKQLDRVWDLRITGDIVAARDAYFDLVNSLETNPADSLQCQADHLRKKGVEKSDIIEFLTFPVSEFRFNQKIDAAIRKGDEVAEIAVELGLSQHFQLLYQCGLNYLVASRYAEALDEFSRAIRCANSPQRSLAARLNEILCLECLGYDYSGKLRQLCLDYEGSEARLESTWSLAIKEQLAALRLREAFEAGDTASLPGLARAALCSFQGSYYAAWLASLPYFSWSEPANTRALIRHLVENTTTYQTRFRLGTLNQSLLRCDRDPSLRLGDQVERLYFWVWSWLVEPDCAKTERCLILWEHLSCIIHRCDLSRDEVHLLLNAGRWICLFAGLDDQMLSTRLATTGSASNARSVFLDYECCLLDYLFSLRDGKAGLLADEAARLKCHRAASMQYFDLPLLVQESLLQSRDGGRKSESRGPLAKFIAELTTLRLSFDEDDGDDLTINLMHRTVRLPGQDGSAEGRATIAQERVVLLLTVIGDRAMVPVVEVLSRCFAVMTYDPQVHDAKLAQLLVLANKLVSPHLSLRRKRHQIFVERRKGLRIVTAGGTDHVSLLFEQRERVLSWKRDEQEGDLDAKPPVFMPGKREERRQQASSTPSVRRDQIKLSNNTTQRNLSGWLRRSDFEALLQSSRATTGRRIQEWLALGLVAKHGVGKASKYKMTPKLLSTLRISKEEP